MQIAVSKAAVAISGSVSTANSEYEKLMDPEAMTPTPPVHAARLSALLRSLANAEGAVSESIKARQDLIKGLEKLLESNRTALSSDEYQYQELVDRKSTVEAKKRDVEDGIMRGLSAETSSPGGVESSPGPNNQTNGNRESSVEPDRPEIEELTPPPEGTHTAVGSPFADEAAITTTTGADITQEQQPDHTEPPPETQPPLFPAGSDLLSSLSMPPARSYADIPLNGGSNKKRKIEPEYDDFVQGDGMEDLDEDVAELLRAESGGR